MKKKVTVDVEGKNEGKSITIIVTGSERLTIDDIAQACDAALRHLDENCTEANDHEFH